ncbi:MAG: hypothetical protein ACKVRP_13940 [Bacteroidota bacterium]
MKLILLCGTLTGILLLAWTSGCRDSSTTPNDDPSLSAPTVFIPLGILKSPRGIAVDSAGFVWVSDTYNDRITRFTPDGSQLLSLPGFTLPTGMGIDKSTNDVLAIVNGNTIVRINVQTENPTIVSTITSGNINTSSSFDVISRQQVNVILLVQELGDIDGATNGDIYVSCFDGGNENHVLRVRNGEATAVAFSRQQPDDSLDRGSKFLSTDTFGTVYTAFVLPNAQQSNLVYPYVVSPGNVFSSHAFSGTVLSGGVKGAGIDQNGVLYVADARTGSMEILSTVAEQRIDRLDIPPIQGMAEPVAWDIAVGRNGSVFVAVVDLLDTSHQLGVVLKYTRLNE